FEALSYTWGPATTNSYHKIYIRGHRLHVTQSLHDALSQLRDEVVGYLWVDAVCINQNSDAECSSQVLLMGDIYFSALRVIVWLG
ncbi:heterokaryon incompatibility, partial [Mytilinidion resinicola]